MKVKHFDFGVPGWFLALIFSFAGLLLSQAEEDWSRFRGPEGQGVSQVGGQPLSWSATENLPWRTELPGPGGSSPVVFSNRIYLTCYSGYAVPGTPDGDLSSLKRHLVCLAREDGKLLWVKDVPAALPEQDKVRDHGYASSTPLADPNGVYVFFGKSGVLAFNHAGEQLWRADVGSNTHGWGSASSLVLYKDLVIANAAVESESLISLDRKTGKEVWRAGGMKESWNTPILVPVEGKQELVVAIAGKVLGFHPDTGAQLWSCDTGISWYMVPSLVHAGGVVYCIGGRTGGALAVRAGGRGNVTQSHRIWTLNKGSNVSSPVLYRGHLYFLHENLGIAYCVEALSGKVVYEERLPNAGQFYGSPVVAGGRIYAFTRNGRGFVLSAKPQFELVGRNELGDRSSFDASPAVDADRILLRSDKYLYCLQEGGIPAGFVSLFDGTTLNGWQMLGAGNRDWRVVDGTIDCDPHPGAGDRNLWTRRDFTNFELLIDWRIKEAPYTNRAAKIILPDGTYRQDPAGKEELVQVPNVDSGVFLRGQHKSQVNIWCWNIGSGEVWGYRTDASMSPAVRAGVTPKTKADRPIGEWNTFLIKLSGERLWVKLNGQPVIEDAHLPGIPGAGPLALQHHGDRKDGEWGASFVQFRRIYIRELSNSAPPDN